MCVIDEEGHIQYFFVARDNSQRAVSTNQSCAWYSSVEMERSNERGKAGGLVGGANQVKVRAGNGIGRIVGDGSLCVFLLGYCRSGVLNTVDVCLLHWDKVVNEDVGKEKYRIMLEAKKHTHNSLPRLPVSGVCWQVAPRFQPSCRRGKSLTVLCSDATDLITLTLSRGTDMFGTARARSPYYDSRALIRVTQHESLIHRRRGQGNETEESLM